MIYGEIKINSRKVLRVSRDIVNGTSFVQIGIWERDCSRGRLKATNRRVCFRNEDVHDILIALEMMKFVLNRELALAWILDSFIILDIGLEGNFRSYFELISLFFMM